MRALIAESDERAATSIAETLGLVGLKSVHTRHGGEALWYASEQSFSLVVLDLLLPGLNGYRVCRDLRDSGINTPILVVTGKLGVYDEVEALESGADDFLRKPFEPPVLAARVTSLLRRPAPFGGLALRVADFSFDPSRRVCRRGGQEPINLTCLEARILHMLVQAGDNPVPRQRLLDEVWGYDFDGSPNVVDIYIGYLRRKLGADTIQTQRGVGFTIRRTSPTPAVPVPDHGKRQPLAVDVLDAFGPDDESRLATASKVGRYEVAGAPRIRRADALGAPQDRLRPCHGIPSLSPSRAIAVPPRRLRPTSHLAPPEPALALQPR